MKWVLLFFFVCSSANAQIIESITPFEVDNGPFELKTTNLGCTPPQLPVAILSDGTRMEWKCEKDRVIFALRSRIEELETSRNKTITELQKLIKPSIWEILTRWFSE